MSGIAIFDMNETTLDLGPVRTLVDELLSTGGGFQVWFQRLLQLSMATTATGQEFQDFGTLARAAFDANAEAGRIAPGPDAFSTVATVLGAISPYHEVPAAMTRLRDAGWTLVALTNSGQAMVDGQVERAGIRDLFDHVLSVEAVQTYKPNAAPYRHALEVVDAQPGDAWMVACHDWDLAGAKAVGLRTAFVERRYMTYASAFAPPDLSVRNFTELADALLA